MPRSAQACTVRLANDGSSLPADTARVFERGVAGGGGGAGIGLAIARELAARMDASLEAESGVDVGFRRTGLLKVEGDAPDEEARRLEGDDLRAVDPGLAPSVTHGWWLPEEAEVEPARLVQAVSVAAARAGAHLRSGVPVVATEQYVKGLGETLCVLKERLPEPAIEKMTFSCCGEEPFPEKLRKLGKTQVIVTGMETHVCVLQTVLQLLEAGYHVHLVRDAVMSRRQENWQTGLEVAAAAGAVITSTEAALFQLLRVAGTEEFKKLSKLVR